MISRKPLPKGIPASSLAPAPTMNTVFAARMLVLRSVPLSAQLRPVLQPFSDLTLETAFGRVVKLLPSELLREIVLARKCLIGIVVVFVARTVALGLHELGRR